MPRPDPEQEWSLACRLVGDLGSTQINHGLGLYAALRMLERAATRNGGLTAAKILTRDLYDPEPPFARWGVAVGLCLGGSPLGPLGETGWQAICDNAAKERGVKEYRVKSVLHIAQLAYCGLDWLDEERDEVEKEIQALVAVMEANELARTIAAATQGASSPRSPSRI